MPVRSGKLTVRIQQSPVLTLSSPGPNTVTATVLASPGEPALAAQLQVNVSGSTWTTIAGGTIGDDGSFTATARNVAAGAHIFRAYIGGDPSNGVLAGYSPGRALTVPGTPAGQVGFTRVQYNSPGADDGSNASLNGEWVRITNSTPATVELKGWTIRDAAGHVYTFSSTYRVGAGGSAYLHTGKATARPTATGGVRATSGTTAATPPSSATAPAGPSTRARGAPEAV